MSSAAHLLSLVDTRAAHADEAKTAAALEHERDEIDEGRGVLLRGGERAGADHLLPAASRRSLIVISASPPSGSRSVGRAVAALVAGAVGAVVSVIQRINSGSFELDYDVGGPYAFFLGGLRPLIGGAFGMAITFAFNGGLLHLPCREWDHDDDRRLALRRAQLPRRLQRALGAGHADLCPAGQQDPGAARRPRATPPASAAISPERSTS